MSRSQRFWDRVSSTSDTAPVGVSGTALKTVEATRLHLTPEHTVLDFGCGTGDLSLALAPAVKSLEGIDTSQGMIDVAQARADQLDLENVRFTQRSLADMAARPGAFDVVTAFNVLHLVDNVEHVAQQVHNLLAPDGLFISATACMGGRISMLGLTVRVMSTLRLMPSVQFYKKDELDEHIAAAGFQIVERTELSDLPDYFLVAKKIAH